MKKDKSNISHGQSYQEIGEYWDNHDLSEVWEQTESAGFVLSDLTAKSKDPIFELGQNPVTADVDDASIEPEQKPGSHAEHPKEYDAERPIWETVAGIGAEISDDEWEKLPDDSSINYKHYLYDAPPKQV